MLLPPSFTLEQIGAKEGLQISSPTQQKLSSVLKKHLLGCESEAPLTQH